MFNEQMLPPWIVFPHLTRQSVVLRLGTAAEDYAQKWTAWLQTLSKADYLAYAELYPEPIMWLGTLEQYYAKDFSKAYEKTHRFYEKERKKRETQKYTREKMIREFAQRERKDIRFFWGHQPARNGRLSPSCFSQWWKESFHCNDQSFCCMEQMMMASKARLFRDENAYRQIMQSDDPAEMKKLGRRVKGFDSTIWNRHKFSIILMGNYCKFTASPEMREYLLSTGDDILVEASPYDCIWGIGLEAGNPHAADPALWRGENLLGFALMQARDEIRMVFANAAPGRNPQTNITGENLL